MPNRARTRSTKCYFECELQSSPTFKCSGDECVNYIHPQCANLSVDIPVPNLLFFCDHCLEQINKRQCINDCITQLVDNNVHIANIEKSIKTLNSNFVKQTMSIDELQSSLAYTNDGSMVIDKKVELVLNEHLKDCRSQFSRSSENILFDIQKKVNDFLATSMSNFQQQFEEVLRKVAAEGNAVEVINHLVTSPILRNIQPVTFTSLKGNLNDICEDDDEENEAIASHSANGLHGTPSSSQENQAIGGIQPEEAEKRKRRAEVNKRKKEKNKEKKKRAKNTSNGASRASEPSGQNLVPQVPHPPIFVSRQNRNQASEPESNRPSRTRRDNRFKQQGVDNVNGNRTSKKNKRNNYNYKQNHQQAFQHSYAHQPICYFNYGQPQMLSHWQCPQQVTPQYQLSHNWSSNNLGFCRH